MVFFCRLSVQHPKSAHIFTRNNKFVYLFEKFN